MIITCEQCNAEFRLDEKLIKEGGSKVRCSSCRHVFTVFPPGPEPAEEPEIILEPDMAVEPETSEGDISEGMIHENLEETVALDSPPSLDEGDREEPDVEVEDFDKAFEEALGEDTIKEVTQVQAVEISEMEEEPFGDKEDEEELSTRELFDQTPETDESLDEIGVPHVAPSRKTKKGGSKGLLILFIIVLLLGGAAYIYFLRPDLIPESLSFLKTEQKQPTVDMDVSKITFNKDVDGFFVEESRAGKLYVVKGSIRNDFSSKRSYILIKGVILDDESKPIRHKLAYAGNTFTKQELATMPMKNIDNSLRNRKGKNNTNIDIAPGASVPFMIVFENLPENISEFEVGMVSSSPNK